MFLQCGTEVPEVASASAILSSRSSDEFISSSVMHDVIKPV